MTQPGARRAFSMPEGHGKSNPRANGLFCQLWLASYVEALKGPALCNLFYTSLAGCWSQVHGVSQFRLMTAFQPGMARTSLHKLYFIVRRSSKPDRHGSELKCSPRHPNLIVQKSKGRALGASLLRLAQHCQSADGLRLQNLSCKGGGWLSTQGGRGRDRERERERSRHGRAREALALQAPVITQESQIELSE